MAGLTLAQAEARLTEYMEAEAKVLAGQSYTIAGGGASRTLTRANLTEIREGIAHWNSMCQQLSTGRGARVRGVQIG